MDKQTLFALKELDATVVDLVTTLFQIYDENGNGTLDRAEMWMLVQDLKKQNKINLNSVEMYDLPSFNELFNKYDHDNSNEIDQNEMYQFVRDLYIVPTPDKEVEAEETSDDHDDELCENDGAITAYERELINKIILETSQNRKEKDQTKQ